MSSFSHYNIIFHNSCKIISMHKNNYMCWWAVTFSSQMLNEFPSANSSDKPGYEWKISEVPFRCDWSCGLWGGIFVDWVSHKCHQTSTCQHLGNLKLGEYFRFFLVPFRNYFFVLIERVKVESSCWQCWHLFPRVLLVLWGLAFSTLDVLCGS